MTTTPDHDYDICLECQTRDACIRSFFAFLQRNPELEATLEQAPQRPIQFVVAVGNLHDDYILSIEWEVIDEDPHLILKDIECSGSDLDPTIRMDADYEELKEAFLQILFDEWRLGERPE